MSTASAPTASEARRATWRPIAILGVRDGLILFDGVCVFCSRWVRFVIARDPAARFRFVAIQSDLGRALAARLGIDSAAPETNAVIIRGQAYFKSDAALHVLRRLPRWSWSGALMVVPRPLRDWAYDQVARNRYRWFGRTEVCMMPTVELAARFVIDERALGEP
ncbi:MAG: DUF393 domain-containing protein [Proteobacteria bacterium]|nr:DUF393 domain-containing protein [Pseudomonadota bacterium]